MEQLTMKNLQQHTESGFGKNPTRSSTKNIDNGVDRAQTENRHSDNQTGYFVADFEDLQANLQALGPAIDDEMAARYIIHLGQTNDEALPDRAGNDRKIAQVSLDSGWATPQIDQETFDTIFSTAGPAIDDMTIAHYTSSYFA